MTDVTNRPFRTKGARAKMQWLANECGRLRAINRELLQAVEVVASAIHPATIRLARVSGSRCGLSLTLEQVTRLQAAIAKARQNACKPCHKAEHAKAQEGA